MNDLKQKQILTLLLAGDLDVTCNKCHYNLRSITGERKTCPECGALNSFSVEPTPDEIQYVEDRISFHVLRLLLGVSLGIFVVVTILAISFFASEVIIGIPALWFAYIWTKSGGRNLRIAFPRDLFYSTLLRFPFTHFMLLFGTFMVSGIVALGLHLIIRKTDVLPRDFSGLVVSVTIILPMLFMIYLVLVLVKRMPKDVFRTRVREGAIRLAKHQKWNAITNRIDMDSIPSHMKEDQQAR